MSAHVWHHLNQTFAKLSILLMLTCTFIFHPAHATTPAHSSTSKKTTQHSTLRAKSKTTTRKASASRSSTKKTSTHKKASTRLANHKPKKTRTRTSTKPKTVAHKAKTPINTTNIHRSKMPTYLLTDSEKSLVEYIRQSISSIQYSKYKLGGNRIDQDRGIYVVDCSAYVDHVLKETYPKAFTSLASWSGNDRPTTDDFYQYFTNLSEKATHWDSLDKVESLRPGDVIVFRNINARGHQTGGHIMIVMDTPKHVGDTYYLRIADSAPSGHTKDTRSPRVSGIGIGTMLLKVNPKTHEPMAYAWKEGASFIRNVRFAMARPIKLS